MNEQETQAEAEAQAAARMESERRRMLPRDEGGIATYWERDAFLAGAEWERARHVPVEVTDEMMERAANAIRGHAAIMTTKTVLPWHRELAHAVLSAALGGGE